MKTNYFLIGLVICSAFFSSCAKSRPSKVEGKLNVEIETPKVLLKEELSTSDLVYPRYNSYQEDMVNELFNEACKGNRELEDLKDNIQTKIFAFRDSAEELIEYKNVVEKVWTSANSHINNISNDTVLSKSLALLSSNNEKEFLKKIEPYQREIDKINLNREHLENGLEALKVKIAMKMIKGFQDNEIPELESLVAINSDLIQLLKKTEIEIRNASE